MRKTCLGLAAVALLALTGCAAGTPTETPAPDTAETTTPAPAETPDTAATPGTDVTPGPVQVTPQAETPTDPTEGMTAEERYIYLADQSLRGWGYELTEDEILSAGLYACELLASDPGQIEYDVLDGAGMAVDESIWVTARDHLC